MRGNCLLVSGFLNRVPEYLIFLLAGISKQFNPFYPKKIMSVILIKRYPAVFESKIIQF